MTSETTQKFYYPSEEVVKNAAVSGMEAYKALCAEAEQDYEGFWGKRAKELIDWQTPFTQVLDESEAPFFKWFADGKLNVSITTASIVRSRMALVTSRADFRR